MDALALEHPGTPDCTDWCEATSVPAMAKRRRTHRESVERCPEFVTHTIPAEILAKIDQDFRLGLLTRRERRYLVQLVDSMQSRKQYSIPVSTKLLTVRFTQKGRDRICRFLKRLSRCGLMTHDESYVPKSKGRVGTSKKYGISASLLLRCATEPHMDGPVASVPVSPASVSISASEVLVDKEDTKAAYEILGWDGFGLDLSGAVYFPVSCMSLGMTEGNLIDFVLARDPKAATVNPANGMSKLETIIDSFRRFTAAIATGESRAFRRNGRVYHEATGLPSYCRQMLQFTYDGSTSLGTDVDVSAMHWCIVVSTMPESAEKRRLVESCERGTFYQDLEAGLAAVEGRIDGGVFKPNERGGKFKKIATMFILYCDRWIDKVRWGFDAAMQLAFPELRKALRRLQEYRSLREVSFALTRVEGEITIPVFEELLERGIPCLPYHDGMFVPMPYRDLCIHLYRQKLEEVLGFIPMVRVKDPVDGLTNVLDLCDVDDPHFDDDVFSWCDD